MIRGALQREIHGNLNIELGRFLHKVFEIFHRAKLGIDAVVATISISNRPRNTRVSWSWCQRVVASLAK